MPDPIVNHAIEEYLAGLVPPRSSVLQELEEHASTNHVPIVGPVEGNLLYLLARTNGARRVLELGTATGYSGLWLAAAVAPLHGRVTTLEMNRERAEFARANFARAGYAGMVEVILGDALKVLPSLAGPYDFIFNDLACSASQDDFALRLLDLCLPRLASGGLMVMDNAFAGSRILDANPVANVRGVLEYTRRVANHPDLETIVVPLRDGVVVSRKK
ncbi:MAG: O-methyltransferase [Anaerolineae bacterium]|nr:O-methyltransferase [Anaerolineae bacterium]